jgi:hypothetical protein
VSLLKLAQNQQEQKEDEEVLNISLTNFMVPFNIVSIAFAGDTANTL